MSLLSFYQRTRGEVAQFLFISSKNDFGIDRCLTKSMLSCEEPGQLQSNDNCDFSSQVNRTYRRIKFDYIFKKQLLVTLLGAWPTPINR